MLIITLIKSVLLVKYIYIIIIINISNDRGEDMQLDALKTFITLVEVNNFTKTSEILHISQPSVSLHIKNLEQELQTTLFIRSQNRCKLHQLVKFFINEQSKSWR